MTPHEPDVYATNSSQRRAAQGHRHMATAWTEPRSHTHPLVIHRLRSRPLTHSSSTLCTYLQQRPRDMEHL